MLWRSARARQGRVESWWRRVSFAILRHGTGVAASRAGLWLERRRWNGDDQRCYLMSFGCLAACFCTSLSWARIADRSGDSEHASAWHWISLTVTYDGQ